MNRIQRLKSCGAKEPQLEELLTYTDNPAAEVETSALEFPLESEPLIERWELYAQEAGSEGVLGSLRKRFPQLQFPIREGISQEDAYRRATRRGEFPETIEHPLELTQDSTLELGIHPTMGGRIPVLVAGNRVDFESLVQAFTDRNEPRPVPASMGACIVRGLNNWDRIAAYRAEWEREHPGAGEGDWNIEFKSLVPRKHLYQDTFIILSNGEYSAVPSSALGMDSAQWREDSVCIRREHEVFHYFTHRALGTMRNNLLDELLADFFGLLGAYGAFDENLALRFLGLEDYPRYRDGARLENYREPPISDECLRVIQCLCYQAVDRLGKVASELSSQMTGLEERSRLALVLAKKRLDELADDGLIDEVREQLTVS